jgi:hypothetical protein
MKVSGQLHASAPLPPGNSPPPPGTPFDRRLVGPWNRSERCGGEKNLTMLGIELGPSSPSLHRLSCPSCLEQGAKENTWTEEG